MKHPRDWRWGLIHDWLEIGFMVGVVVGSAAVVIALAVKL